MNKKTKIAVIVGLLMAICGSGVVMAMMVLGQGKLSVKVGPPIELDKNAFSVYSDKGILPVTDAWMWAVWTWDGSDWDLEPGEFDGDYPMGSAPEGSQVFMTKSGPDHFVYDDNNNLLYIQPNYAGWGVFLAGTSEQSDHIIDLSDYDELKFWVKTSDNLKVEVRKDNRSGPKSSIYISGYGWNGENTWQEITIPARAFGLPSTKSRIFSPFMITVEHGDNTFYVDNVRWIKKSGVGNVAPTADFAYLPTYPTPSSTITFTGQGIDPDGKVTSWLWDFGDGTTSTQRNPTHQYTTGVYTVTLTVTDDEGASDSTSENIVVTYTPTASFTYLPTSPTIDNVIQFTDNSTDPDGAIVSWEWNFGDGNNSTEQNPTHQYSCFGKYYVRLKVTDDLGKISYKSQEIAVSAGPGIYGIYGDGGTGVDLSYTRLYDNDNSPGQSPWRVTVYTSGEGCPPDPDWTWRYIFDNSEEGSGGARLMFDSAKDMSAYENLVFWVKGESGGENFKIGIKGGGVESMLSITDYISVTRSWQEVSIPLTDFTGVSLSSVEIPWDMYFSNDFSGGATVYIDYVRCVGKP